MKILSGILLGLCLLVGLSSPAWAQFEAVITSCETEPNGGMCQLPLLEFASREERIVIVDLPGVTCFPRVVNQRISNGPAIENAGPFVVYAAITSIGIPAETQAARISFYINNSALFMIHHPWLGFVWECDPALSWGPGGSHAAD